MFSLIIDPLPTKQFLPIFTPPFTITPVDIWELSFIETSCSIIDPVLITTCLCILIHD